MNKSTDCPQSSRVNRFDSRIKGVSSMVKQSVHCVFLFCIFLLPVSAFQLHRAQRTTRGPPYDLIRSSIPGKAVRRWDALILHQSLPNEGTSVSTRSTREQDSSLKAVAIGSPSRDISLPIPSVFDDFKAVMATALLITGNTIGAGSLVLPEKVAGPGMSVSAVLFGGEKRWH